MSSADKIRVTIFLSGDSSNGKILAISDDLSFSDLLTQATAKLESKQKLTRVFIYNGSEITDALDVIDGDRLYFTAGDVPVNCFEKPTGFTRAGRRAGPPRVASDSQSTKADADKAAAAAAAAQPSKGLFATLVGAAVNTTAYVAESTVSVVKNYSPSLVVAGIEKVESGVKTTADVTGVTFVAKQAGNVAGAVVNAVDSTIDAVYDKVKSAAADQPAPAK